MSNRSRRNSLPPDDLYTAIQAVSSELTELRESWIAFTTETKHRLDALERSISARVQRGEKIRIGAITALIGASISTAIGLLLNAIL